MWRPVLEAKNHCPTIFITSRSRVTNLSHQPASLMCTKCSMVWKVKSWISQWMGSHVARVSSKTQKTTIGYRPFLCCNKIRLNRSMMSYWLLSKEKLNRNFKLFRRLSGISRGPRDPKRNKTMWGIFILGVRQCRHLSCRNKLKLLRRLILIAQLQTVTWNLPIIYDMKWSRDVLIWKKSIWMSKRNTLTSSLCQSTTTYSSYRISRRVQAISPLPRTLSLANTIQWLREVLSKQARQATISQFHQNSARKSIPVRTAQHSYNKRSHSRSLIRRSQHHWSAQRAQAPNTGLNCSKSGLRLNERAASTFVNKNHSNTMSRQGRTPTSTYCPSSNQANQSCASFIRKSRPTHPTFNTVISQSVEIAPSVSTSLNLVLQICPQATLEIGSMTANSK